MNPVTDSQQALALINRPDILALLAAQSNTGPPRAAQAVSAEESDSDLDAGGETDLEPDTEDDDILDWQPAKFIPSERIELLSETSSDPGEDHVEFSSHPASSNAGEDPEDHSFNSASSDRDDNGSESLSGDPENKADEETDPEIRSILASEDDLDLDEELLPPSEDIWYDFLDEL